MFDKSIMFDPATVFSAVSLPALLDGVMLLAIAGLWFMWWRNARRQHMLESMLIGSAKQLNEASVHLRQVMEHIRQLTDRTAPRQHKDGNKDMGQVSSSTEEDIHARILGMHQEGKAAENIAKKLGVPLGEVRLVLKLHATRAC